MPFFSGLRGRGPAPAAAFFMPAHDPQAAAPLLEQWFRRLQADHARLASWRTRHRATAAPMEVPSPVDGLSGAQEGSDPSAIPALPHHGTE